MTAPASYSMTVVCTEVGKTATGKRFASFARVRPEVPSPFPVTVVCHDIDDQDRTLYVQTVDELVHLLSLDSTGDLDEDIAENVVDGIVHCTLCPHAMCVDEVRQLIFGKSREDVENDAALAADCI